VSWFLPGVRFLGWVVRSPTLFRSLVMRTAVVVTLLTLSGTGWSGEPAKVGGVLGGKQRTFVRGLDTEVEGLILAVLGSCSVERESNKGEWDEAVKHDQLRVRPDHLRVRFSGPRTINLNVEKERFEVDELVVTGSATTLPDWILARCGDRYHAFSKYNPHIWFLMQQQVLKGLQ
jgi:hypothetical protein